MYSGWNSRVNICDSAGIWLQLLNKLELS